MEITFIGSGDAFGSGGRLQTCILINTENLIAAVDFGATSLTGLRSRGIDPNSISVLLISHLHGDHCGGVPFLLLDAITSSKRKEPLTIIGPEGTEKYIYNLWEALYPGSSSMQPDFQIEFLEIEPSGQLRYKDFIISAIKAKHSIESNPLALKISVEDKVIVYTGDGAPTDKLVDFTENADIAVAECFSYSEKSEMHSNYMDVKHLKAKKLILTHMNRDMLSYTDKVPELCAYDGLKVEIQ